MGWTVMARAAWSLATAAITFLLVADFGPTRELPCPDPTGGRGTGTICILRIEPLLPLAAVVAIGLAAGWGVWWLSRPRGQSRKPGDVPPVRLAVATAVVAADVTAAFLLAWGVGSATARFLAAAFVALNFVVAAVSTRTTGGPVTDDGTPSAAQ